MKIYVVSYLTAESGKLEPFVSKRAAQKRLAELNRQAKEEDQDWLEQVFGIDEVDYPATKQGLMDAISYGADSVYK